MEAFEQDVQQCIAAMEKGGSILYPTDTIWGLGCDATNETAVKNISSIKHRVEGKSYVVLMADTKMLRQYLAMPPIDLEGLVEEQSAPTSIIYSNVIGVAQEALAQDGSLAIRIPKDDFCTALLKRYKKPIISTSANISGEHHPKFYAEMSEDIKNSVDYVVQWRQNDNKEKTPSSILKIMDDGRIMRIR